MKLISLAFGVIWIVGVANAQNIQTVPMTKISYLENGWSGNGLAIHVSGAGIDGCPAANNKFALSDDHPGYDTILALALSAQAQDADIELIVDKGNCLFGDRTRILSIRLYD